MTTQVTTKTVENRDDDDDEGAEYQITPLFDRARDKKSKGISKIAVMRTDPNEGHLGYLGPDASEHEIAQKWGGGEFRLQAKNEASQIVTTMTMKIAGDPIFQSEIEEARWRRLHNLTPRPRSAEGGATNIKDLVDAYEARDEKRRAEERERRAEERKELQDREERARREQREHEEKLAREIRDTDDRRRKDEADREERRLKAQREDDERKTKQHREDLERIDASNKAQLAQTQQFFQQLATMAKDKGSGGDGAIKTLMAGIELAMKMRPEGDGQPPDALTALMNRLPETLSEARETAKAVYDEVTGGKAKNPGKPGRRAAAPAAAAEETEDEITITGSTASRFKKMIAVLQQQGKDPETVIDGLAQYVIQRSGSAPTNPKPTRNAPKKARPAARAVPPPRRAPRVVPKAAAARKTAAPARAPRGRVIPLKPGSRPA